MVIKDLEIVVFYGKENLILLVILRGKKGNIIIIFMYDEIKI